MKIGLQDEETYTGWFVEWIEQWSQFWHDCNWYTFHPIKVEVEDERNMGGWEITVVVFGLGFRLRRNYAVTESVNDIMRQVRLISPEKQES